MSKKFSKGFVCFFLIMGFLTLRAYAGPETGTGKEPKPIEKDNSSRKTVLPEQPIPVEQRAARELENNHQSAGVITPDLTESFRWVFGNLIDSDTAMVRKVLADKPGKRHYVDHDGDGKPEEVWFVDISPRHNSKNLPMLVKVVDEDGDLVMGGEPDLDSDLYIADWNGDGVFNVILDYEDNERITDSGPGGDAMTAMTTCSGTMWITPITNSNVKCSPTLGVMKPLSPFTSGLAIKNGLLFGKIPFCSTTLTMTG